LSGGGDLIACTSNNGDPLAHVQVERSLLTTNLCAVGATLLQDGFPNT
jgi:hypothetical protein